jgi:hypothetical protein
MSLDDSDYVPELNDMAVDFPDEPESIDLPVFDEPQGPSSEPAWVAHLRNTDGFLPGYKMHKSSISRRKVLADNQNLPDVARDVLAYMNTKGIDLATLLYAVSGCIDDLKGDQGISGERAALVHHPDFPVVLDGFDRHASRNPQRGNPVQTFASSCLKRAADQELSKLKPIMRMDASEVSEESFLSTNMASMMTETKLKAPLLFDFMSHIAETRLQHKRNKLKTPDNVCNGQMVAVHLLMLY